MRSLGSLGRDAASSWACSVDGGADFETVAAGLGEGADAALVGAPADRAGAGDGAGESDGAGERMEAAT